MRLEYRNNEVNRSSYLTSFCDINYKLKCSLLKPPYNKLNILNDSGSIGKCWVFHLNHLGELTGLYIPSGYRIYDVKPDTSKNDFF